MQYVLNMKKYLIVCILIFEISCTTKSDTEKEIEKISIDIEFVRFDKIFGEASINDIPELKKQYPSFFPEQYHDSIWVQKMQDTLQQQ